MKKPWLWIIGIVSVSLLLSARKGEVSTNDTSNPDNKETTPLTELKRILSKEIDVHIYQSRRDIDSTPTERFLCFKGEKDISNYVGIYYFEGARTFFTVNTPRTIALGMSLNNIAKAIGKEKMNKMIIDATT